MACSGVAPACMQHWVDHSLWGEDGKHKCRGALVRAGGCAALWQWHRLCKSVHGTWRVQLGLLGRSGS